ncbi:HlyD family efflux transporter periplasmic adaptor subunit [Planctomyces sp. SH-PL62]|uniref:HlyD family efflux transporter periplasmic adaptor subunit n=1 Tax=Planctomyces sp. SH-PL62 TaxID=1636152 RepID=UPI00078C8CA9|nr:HlyD family efflux transporter periplasmic adaptor subunit [Planctomyces sp. SH-PL62]AMV36738.1 Multidrug resistance protein MdtN [Planctomyces sp. SH-PL62]
MTDSRTGGDRPRTPSFPPLAAILVLLAAAPASLKAQSSTAPAPVAASRIHALGRIEPATGLITIGSRPGQRIEEIKVAVGDDVAAGQVLAILEGRTEAEAQLAMAELNKRKADFQRAAAKDKLNLERAQFDKTHPPRLQAATKVAEQLRKLLDKATPLYNLGSLAPGVVDRAKLEEEGRFVELVAKTTQAELDKSLLEIEAELTAQKRKLEDAQVADDNPEFQLADAQIALAKAALEQTQVVAPRAGKVLDVIGRAGEVGSGQLLVMGDVSAIVAVAEVFQTDAPRVKEGDAATVSILGREIPGKVTHVGSLVGRNQAASLDPRALKDVRVVKVRVALDEPGPASRLINMEAEVAITPGGGG